MSRDINHGWFWKNVTDRVMIIVMTESVIQGT